MEGGTSPRGQGRSLSHFKLLTVLAFAYFLACGVVALDAWSLRFALHLPSSDSHHTKGGTGWYSRQPVHGCELCVVHYGIPDLLWWYRLALCPQQ